MRNLSVKTFGYWLRKYRKGKSLSVERSKKVPETFIPVEVSGDRASNGTNTGSGRIEVSFPNGAQLSCRVGLDIGRLKSLINF